MKRLCRFSPWLPLLLLLAAGLAGFSGPAWSQAGKTQGGIISAQNEEEPEAAPQFLGALDIRIQSGYSRLNPPAELVLSNPRGEAVGFDPRYNSTYQEIPGATYKREVVPGDPSTEAAVLYLPNAVSGTYSLRVIGTGSGQYRLSMKGYDRKMSHADLLFTLMIQPGEVNHYIINYSNAEGASLSARRTRTRE